MQASRLMERKRKKKVKTYERKDYEKWEKEMNIIAKEKGKEKYICLYIIIIVIII